MRRTCSSWSSPERSAGAALSAGRELVVRADGASLVDGPWAQSMLAELFAEQELVEIRSDLRQAGLL